MAASSSSSTGVFQIAPSPWKDMTAEVLTTVAYARKKDGIPPSSYSPLEAVSDFAERYGEPYFEGGPCFCMIVRYKDTPVGLYDELVWVPGQFRDHDSDKTRFRVTRIYVSSRNSIYNGRKNWNIPKTLASFNFIASDCTYLPYSRIEIALPRSPAESFVTLDLSPIPLISRLFLPMSTAYLPLDMELAMPPLPQSETWQDDGMVGSENDEWQKCGMTMSGTFTVIRVSGQLGDSHAFPVLHMGSYWVWAKDVRMTFGSCDA